MSAATVKGKRTGRKSVVDPGSETTAPSGPTQADEEPFQPQAAVLEANLAEVNTQNPLTTTIGSRIEAASLIFDVEWYRIAYPDVAAASLDPVRHYFDNGFREGRNPNRYFDTNWYASSNPDVAAAGLNPFLHYLLYGAREGRRPAP